MNVDDLKTAVAKALETVRTLRSQLSETEAEVDAKMDALSALDTKRETSEQNLDAACSKLEESAKRGHESIATAGDAARDAVVAARQAVVTNATEAQKALAESQEGTTVFHGHVNEADAEMKTRLAEVDQEIRNLASQATTLTTEIGHAIQAVDQLLGEEAADLQRLLQAVTAKSEQARETLRSECSEPIAEDEQKASGRQQDLTQTVDESFQLAAGHAKEVATYCVQERDHELTGALAELEDASRDVTAALDTLRDRTAEARQTAVQAADKMDEALNDGTDSLDSAVKHVESVLGVLADFGFVL